jgi:hypothetical protein
MSDTDSTADTVADTTQEGVPAEETFSLSYVQQLRGEAAKYRNEKNVAVDAAKSALAQEYDGKLQQAEEKYREIEAANSGLALDLVKIRAVIEAGVPSESVFEFADLIQGEDEASVSDSVAKVKALLGKQPAQDRPVDPSQGSGNTIPLNGDPLLKMLEQVVGRR